MKKNGPTARPIEDRLWERVRKSSEPDGCWEWTGARHEFGYGRIGLRPNVHEYTHRLSWMLFRGPIPDGLFVLHKCDNPPCVNPDHLFLGTQKDNLMDCARKGRTVYQRHPEKCPWRGVGLPVPRIGENNGRSILTEAKVLEMRAAARAGESHASIARRYGVSAPQANHAIIGRAWRHLPGAVRRRPAL